MKKNEVKSLAREALKAQEKAEREQVRYDFRDVTENINRVEFESAGLFEKDFAPITDHDRYMHAQYNRRMVEIDAKYIALNADLQAA